MTTKKDDSLGRKLVGALKNSSGAGKREIEVEHDGTTAKADVHGAGPYGSSIDRLTVVGPDIERSDEQKDRAIRRQARQIADDVTYLPERLREHEVEPGLGSAVLRSRPEEMRDREYGEVEVKGGREVEVSRYRYDPDKTRRDRVPQNYSHELLGRLTDDLGGILETTEEDGD